MCREPLERLVHRILCRRSSSVTLDHQFAAAAIPASKAASPGAVARAGSRAVPATPAAAAARAGVAADTDQIIQERSVHSAAAFRLVVAAVAVEHVGVRIAKGTLSVRTV